ncbi:MAG: methylenetetrahydrofolate reductase C-terminal domain-containing protein [Actinobacteria bacterium]|nr:methylenetetrahydrofolate reductase C-terminal domain-containing protein [Actinomycetota bacterium]MBU1944982.1 methylenetetrahydrofolate reductase C-terminal domain-containing protein [Actinomycetota bacterium]MBU2688463.1 methylenetetrahydrofolate reductase C-terminal domain-containing protein [Actinomycetota bacterium]
MKSITTRKPLEELLELLGDAKRVFVVGCGTCPTLIGTGGVEQVAELSASLAESGRKIVGTIVLPVACEPLPFEARGEFLAVVDGAESVFVMSCAYGVRQVSDLLAVPTLPALNTMFVGREEQGGEFQEECSQCGDCVLGLTGGICPITRCAKSLFNGPCGGSVGGLCEIGGGVPCGWQMIYDRLKALGRLELLEEILPVRDWSKSFSGGPGHYSMNQRK